MAEAIAQRFSDAVGLHLIANFRPDVQPGTPLLLGIQGPPGEGKTYQAERILEDAGIHTVLLSGGELESPNAGAPAARMRAAYLEAGGYADAGTPAVVLLNDADAAIGSWGELTQYTVNTQNLITELMHLADYPARVEGRRVRRTPVILTGNDFTRLYAPLRRSGRMRIFSWRMQPAERASAVHSLFPWLSETQAGDLVRRFPDEPISFWAAVRRRMDDAALTTALYRHGLGDLARSLVSRSRVRIDDRPHPIEDILVVAKSMAADTAHDFLSS
ncbi:AAA family ATPase [Actinomadura sp. NTSP31]|uniref:AAA family ATPase n=1 Tax=Actinomadura sp. NTSP31 TaxID=1735447 RepID=UPI0035BED8D1